MSKNKKPAILKSKKTSTTSKKSYTSKISQGNGLNEPFSYANKSEKDKAVKCGIYDNLLKSDMVDDLKKITNNCTNVASCSIASVLEVANSTITLTEQVLSKTSLSLSNCLGKNVAISQDLLKCKDVGDVISIQKKIFETNFSSLMDFFLDIGYITQAFSAKNVDNALIYLDKNIESCMPNCSK